jgi:hypothetical protein
MFVTMSPKTHFARCLSKGKRTAQGFWAWVPTTREWPRCAARCIPGAVKSASVAAYGAAIVAAAARVQRLG